MTEIGLNTQIGYVAVRPSTFLAVQVVTVLLAGAGSLWSAIHGKTVLLALFATLIILVTLFGLFTSVEVKERESNGR